MTAIASPAEVVIGIHIPSNIRSEWYRKRDFHCTCGFQTCHPFCQCCGLAIGPEHIQRDGAMATFDVYQDILNEDTGVWEVVHISEDRLVCASCKIRIAEGISKPDPIRVESQSRVRAVAVNAWRRRHGAFYYTGEQQC